ncbi:SDR family oxidoreductase [Xanthomonas translucens]|nr:SDR family oxidoreductase [Xanthomonas translucens]
MPRRRRRSRDRRRPTNRSREDAMNRFEGKVAVVTGAGAGIGKACALAIAREGARVVVADIDGPAATACAAQIASAAGQALAVTTDIADAQAVAALFEAAQRHFGGVDLLVNNASAMQLTPRDRALLELDMEVWDQTMATNLRGTLLCCRQAVPRMIARGGGAIIVMSSCQGLSGDTAQTSYAASKAAMNMLSTSLATQYGHAQIRCNAVAPGLIMTERLVAKLDDATQRHLRRHQLLPRVGRAEDVAALVAFLLSDDAAFITGQVVCIDGGMLAHVPTYADGGNSRAAAHVAAPDAAAAPHR